MYVFIGLHCLVREAAIRVEVFCKKRCSLRFRKFRRKKPVLESFFNKVSGLTPILKNICQRLLLHCIRTTYFCSNSKGFKEFKIWYLILTKVSLSLLLFCFSMFFLSFSVLFDFFLSLILKRILLS